MAKGTEVRLEKQKQEKISGSRTISRPSFPSKNSSKERSASARASSRPQSSDSSQGWRRRGKETKQPLHGHTSVLLFDGRFLFILSFACISLSYAGGRSCSPPSRHKLCPFWVISFRVNSSGGLVDQRARRSARHVRSRVCFGLNRNPPATIWCRRQL